MQNMTHKEFQIHPLCELIPAIDGATLTELAEDIKRVGLNDPIIIFEGKILDGRSRYEACKIADVAPRFVNFTSVCQTVCKVKSQKEKDAIALDWVVSHNVTRRHLNPSQRAMLGAKLANLGVGQSKADAEAKGLPVVTRTAIAAQLGVNPALISQAKTVAREAPEKVADIEAGKTTVTAIANELKANVPKENVKSSFAQAVIDGTFTGKAFRKKVGELSKLVACCKITVSIVEYFHACTLITSLEGILSALKGLPKVCPLKDIERKIAATKAEKAELFEEITDVLIFGSATYSRQLASLKEQAIADEDMSLIANVETQFEELWAQVQDDLKTAAVSHCEVVRTSKERIAVKNFVDELRNAVPAPQSKEDAQLDEW